MRNLKLTDITTGLGMPIKSGSLKHIQLAYKEVIDQLTRGVVGNYETNKGYVLYGCENSGSGSSFVISAGAIFYNGEIYLVDGVSFSTSGSDVPVCTINTSYYFATEADSVTFTDNAPRNVHEIRKIIVSSGASGSGTVDYSDLVFFTWKKIDVASSYTNMYGTTTIDQILWKYKRMGDILHATLTIFGNVSAYNSGKCAFTFDLPYPMNIDVDDAGNEFWCGGGVNVGTFATANVLPCLFHTTYANPDRMTFKMVGTATGDFTAGCSIIYKIV